jgi:hypothetical protein
LTRINILKLLAHTSREVSHHLLNRFTNHLYHLN